MLVSACGTGESAASADSLFPDVVEVAVTRSYDGTLTFDVTISSPYDAPERYADAWRVVGPEGEVYAVRELLHDHAAEQPFTRSISGITVPNGVEIVQVQGRDLVNGWGGTAMDVAVP